MNHALNAVSKALERMSTGYRVNSAKDDAAGLYVATGLASKIRGLKQAQKNAADGISYIQTGEGILRNMQDILNRIRDLSVQAANGVYAKPERDAMQAEVDSLTAELARLKESATFNGMQIFTDNNLIPPSTYSVPRAVSTASNVPSSFNSAVPAAADSSKVVFNTPSADDPNIISGAVNFTTGETKTIEIDGTTYTCKNTNNKDSQISFSKDLTTGVLTLMSSGFEIKGQTNAAHNIILDGTNNKLYTGSLDDTVRDVNRATGAGGNAIHLGDGNDTAIMSSSQHVYGEGGNDTITLNAGGNAFGGDGDDIITAKDGIRLEGGAGNDYIKNINGSNSTIKGDDGDDTVVIEGGNNNWADGGTGTNTITDSGTNSVLMNFVGVDTKFVTFAKRGDSQVVKIDGKDYKITNTSGNNNTLVYKVLDDGTIDFAKGVGFKIEAQKDVSHKVIIHSSNTTFYSGDKDDNIIGAAQGVVIYAGGGNDTVTANTYNVTIYGERGNNTLTSNFLGDYIFGGTGDETIYVNGGSYATAGDGNDTIYVNTGNMVVDGGNGDDKFIIKNGMDGAFVSGGAGHNTLIDNGINTFFAGFDNANSIAVNITGGKTQSFTIGGINYTVETKNNTDRVLIANYNEITGQITFVGDGVDIRGDLNKKHNVLLRGNDSNFYGGNLDDTIVVNARGSNGYGGKGNDNMTSQYDGSSIYGEDGDDTITVNGGYGYGGDGDDILTVTRGRLDGGTGNDTYNVHASNTSITGTTGNNVFNIYGNNNIIEGGGGTDTFNIIGSGNTVRGMGGNDFFLVDGNNNKIDGGTGVNIAVDNGSSTTATNISTDPNRGVLNFTSQNEVQTFAIGDKTYTVTNQNADGTAPSTNTLSYYYNPITGEIILDGSNLTIDSPLDKNNNLILKGSNTTVNGGDQNDNITIQSGTNNIIHGGKGNDKIVSDTADNTIYGDEGNDEITLNASSGTHTVSGGAGDDIINVKSDGNKDIQGNEGNDTINIASKNNIADSGSGNDKINVNGTGNNVSSGSGTNNFVVTGGNNTITGGADSDTIGISGNNNTVLSGAGNDKINISGESNKASSTEGSNIFNINGKNNNITGGKDDDKIYLRGDKNIAQGKEGNDAFVIYSGNQNDIDGNEGSNTMNNKGVDTIYKNVIDITGLSSTIRLQIGPDGSDNSCIHIDTSFSTDELYVDLSTGQSAADSIDSVDLLLKETADKISYFGAVLNRLDSVIQSQTTSIENYTQARSTILDADMAEESAAFVRNNILTQTSTALFTQAAASRSNIFNSLIRGLNRAS